MKLIHKRLMILMLSISILSLVGCGSDPGEESEATAQLTESKEFSEENLTNIIHHVMGEKDGEEDTIESVSASSDSGYARVVIRYTPFSNGTYKASLLDKAEDILEITKELEGMQFINIEFKGPFTDSYGNREYRPVMRVDMSKETIDKINFDNTIQLDRIADDYWQHPTMQD